MAEFGTGTKPDSESRICPKNVEIERKFKVTEDTERSIIKLGGFCVNDTSFTDSYFDNNAMCLTLSDNWLRCRGGKWQLKSPVSEPENANDTGMYTKYIETTDEQKIIEHVSAILLANSNSPRPVRLNISNCPQSELEFEEWLRQQNLKSFSEFSTHRRAYAMEGDIAVVLDVADFGFSIGEIEVMIGQSDDDITLTEAVAKIEAVASKLGLDDKIAPPGKVSTFLKRYVPNRYKKLLDFGILKQ